MRRRYLTAWIALAIAMPHPAPAQQPDQELRLSVEETTSPVPRGGPLLARVIQDESDLLPGLIADGNIGDIVLQNDFVRAILIHPNRQARVNGGTGALVDIAFRQFPVDGLDYIQTTADTGTSLGIVRYQSVERLEVDGDTTAVVVLKGTANPVPSEPAVEVLTTYALNKDEPYLTVSTTYRNPSADQPATIIPGDVADWGIMNGFSEGRGATGRLAVQASRVIAGLGDEMSVAFLSPRGGPLKAITSQRLAVLQYWGVPELPESLRAQAEAAASARAVAPDPEPAYNPDEIEGPRSLLLTPGGRLLRLPQGSTTEPLNLPSSETNYAPMSRPGAETPYSLIPDARKGGWSEAFERGWDTETPGGAEPRAAEQAPKRLVLAPGQAHTVVRLIAPSGRDLGRATNIASRLQAAANPATVGAIAGVVLESSTANPLSGADILISGGPEFDGTGTPTPVTRTATRPDGTFGIRLPHGRYLVQAILNGRQPTAGPSMVVLSTTSPLVTVPLGMSEESRVALKVTSTEGGQLIPAKVTFVSKPGTLPVWFGSTSSVTSGSRNVQYLPTGQGEFPLTPGRYEMTVSRGPEFDVVRGDLTVVPGDTQKVDIQLDHFLAAQTRGMVSMDAGIMTNSSPAGTLDAESRVIQAACEGVSVIVTGDYGTATDLAPAIAKLGLADRVKSFIGRRWLLTADGVSIDLLAYPLTPAVHQAMDDLVKKERAAGTPPDVILSDLRRQFPQAILQIDRAADPDKGYLHSIPFDLTRNSYFADQLPPPDFDAIQVVEGKNVAMQEFTLPRYFDLAARRAALGQPFLAAMAGSGSRVGAADEVGSMRTYLLTTRNTLDRFDEDAMTTAIRSGRYLLTNGPIIDLIALDPKTNAFNLRPGDLMDAISTQTAIVRPMVYAAPWVGMNSITVYMDGIVGDRTEVMSTNRLLRYPVQANVNSANKVRYLEADTMITATALGFRRTLSPVLSPLPDVFGRDVMPWSMTGPILIDWNSDGKIRPKVKPEPQP